MAGKMKLDFNQDLGGLVYEEGLKNYSPNPAPEPEFQPGISPHNLTEKYIDWLAANVRYITASSYFEALDEAKKQSENGGFILSAAELARGRDKLPRRPLLSNANNEGISTSTIEVSGFDWQGSYFNRDEPFVLVLHNGLDRITPGWLEQSMSTNKGIPKYTPEFMDFLIQNRKYPGSQVMFPIYNQLEEVAEPPREFGAILHYTAIEHPGLPLNERLLDKARAGTLRKTEEDMTHEGLVNTSWKGYTATCHWKKRGLMQKLAGTIPSVGEIKQVVFYYDHFRNARFNWERTTFAIIPGQGRQPIRMGGRRPRAAK